MALYFTVPPECDGWKAGIFLRRSGCSVTALRRAKRTENGLLLDGQPIHTDMRVQAGQQLRVSAGAEQPSAALLPQQLPLTVVWEDEAAAVVEKEAGMAVHPTMGHFDGTVANAWLGLLRARGEQGGFHAVYRLDKDTSGLLLLAKDGLSQPFLHSSCQKLYAAVLQGGPPQMCGTADMPISRADDSLILRCVSPDGSRAVTHYRVLLQTKGYSLAVFLLETGRTHQIRVHMAALGCPLAGDELYGGKKSDGFPRQALHCAALRFCSPSGQRQNLYSPFPAGLLDAAGMPQGQQLLADFCRDWLAGAAFFGNEN